MTEKDKAGLLHPRDRNGRSLSERYATPALEDALDDFRSACAAATVAVRQRLRQLSEQLQARGFSTKLPTACWGCSVALLHMYDESHPPMFTQLQLTRRGRGCGHRW